MTAFDFDVAIVGGGPAGTSTALHLTRAEGIAPGRIALFEKSTHPREKPCAGAVSAWGIDALREIGVPLEVPSATMRGLRILTPRARGAHEGRPLGVVVRRSEYDASLWRRAVGEGVFARDGEGVAQISRISGGWKIQTSACTVTTHLLAACDGAGSTVRKILGITEPCRKGHLYVLETPLLPGDEGPKAGLCDFDLSPSDEGLEGYYWDFPTVIEGAPWVSRGIYHANFTPRKDVKTVLSRALAARGVAIAQVKLKPFSTRPFVARTTLALDALVLVGEAAGIDASTGEGIAQAILFGAIAARHLARATRLGTGDLRGYAADVLRSRVGRHLLQSAWLAPRVYGQRGRMWRGLLARSDFAREAGARWYKGERLTWTAKSRLVAGLVRSTIS